MTIDAGLLSRQVEAWQRVALPTARAAAIAADVNRFNAAAIGLAEAMAFEAEPAAFLAALERFAEE